MFEFLKRKTPSLPYDFGLALKRITTACQKCKAYSIVLTSVYYDMNKASFVVHFECMMKEYSQNKRRTFTLSVRRVEKLFGNDLEHLLDFAVAYASREGAFVSQPQENAPEDIRVQVKNIIRTPRNY